MRRLVLLGVLLATCQAVYAAPQSWKQIAQDALMNGDRARAIEYYEKWVEADPGDAISLYNLACCYALEKRDAEALKTLTRAAEAGWSDSTHTVMDPDLAPLRRSEDFARALNKMAFNARQRSAGYTSHVVKQERWGKYVVVLPDEYDPHEKYPLVVLLHNYGTAAESFADVTRYIDTHGYIYVVPEGAYPALDSEGKGFSYLREMDNYQEDAESAPAAADWIIRAADDAISRYPIDGKRFYVVGFSQGAALAHIVAARYPDRVAGYVAHGGYIIKSVITVEQLENEKKAGTHVLITHGQDDPAVSIDEGVYAASMLRNAGIDVVFESLPAAHVFAPEVGARAGRWLNELMKR